jgi:hypothetical protein
LPGGGDVDVDAEQAGEDRGGQVGGELEERGGAGLARAYAELPQAFGELVGADGASGLPAWEQPRRGSLVTEGSVAPAGGGELADEAGKRLGEDDGFAAEVQLYCAAAGLDVVEGEAADHRWPLGVEEDEKAGSAVGWLEGVVVEQAAGLFPADLGVNDAGRAGPPGGGEVQAGQLVSPGPADKVPGFAAADGLAAGQPCIQVALPRAGQRQIAGGEPAEQGDRGAEVPADPTSWE